MRLGAVILAAGSSSRMGDLKPLLRLGEKSLLGHCHRLFSDVGATDIVVVTGHRSREVAEAASRIGLRCRENRTYHSGMFSSVKCGVSALSPDLDGFFLLPVDMPLIRPATLRSMIAAFSRENQTVIHPIFGGRRGHPPLIPADLIPLIHGHDGPRGLGCLLARVPGNDLAVWDEGVHLDADFPEDLEKFEQRLQRLDIPRPTEALALAELTMDAAGISHGRLVAAVALSLAEALGDAGEKMDCDLLFAAALLHDIAKGQPRHDIRGKEILIDLDLPRLAAIVGQHRDMDRCPSGPIAEWEVVHLADKLVCGSRRMDICQRFDTKRDLCSGDIPALRAIEYRRENALALRDRFERRCGKNVEMVLDAAGL